MGVDKFKRKKKGSAEYLTITSVPTYVYILKDSLYNYILRVLSNHFLALYNL